MKGAWPPPPSEFQDGDPFLPVDWHDASEADIVWIPAVPLPLMGWRTDRCSCGKRFRGKGRQAAYELHYRRAHQRGDAPVNQPQMSVSRAEAKRIYAEVNADSVGTTSDQVRRG